MAADVKDAGSDLFTMIEPIAIARAYFQDGDDGLSLDDEGKIMVSRILKMRSVWFDV